MSLHHFSDRDDSVETPVSSLPSASASVVRLDAYRNRRKPLSEPLAATPDAPPPIDPVVAYANLARAFEAAGRRHQARALSLVLRDRSALASLHHILAQLFFAYAAEDQIVRLRLIEMPGADASSRHQVHKNAIAFFTSVVEAFFRRHAVESRDDRLACFGAGDDVERIVHLFRSLSFERRYNAIVATHNQDLGMHRPVEERLRLERANAPRLL